MIAGIVLAAGASSRMGRPKALLRIGERTFVRAVLDAFHGGGLTVVAAVIRPNQDDVAAEIAGASGPVIVAVNAHPDAGQLSSLIVGLDAVDRPGIDAALVTLVDIPGVRASTVAALVERALASPAPILRAVHRGRHGHPVVFTRAVFDALRHADPARGAKDVVHAFPVEDVEVDDPGITEDVDTPDDYDRMRAAPR